MKTILCVFLLLTGTLLLPTPALANVPPGFGPASLLLILWLIIIFLTAIGGGYVIRKKILAEKGKKQYIGSITYTIIAALFLLLSASTWGMLFLVALVTGGLALFRAVKMNSWSRSARRPDGRPTYLEGANPSRLALASWLLIATTVILVPASIILGMQSGAYTITVNRSQDIVKILRQYAAEEIRIRKDSTVKTRKEELRELHDRFLGSIRERYSHECIIDEQLTGQKFTIFMVPKSKYANFIWPAISFRVDESGKIRAVKVYSPGTRCPKDAKVIADVREPEKDFYPLDRL
jgi:hypothetical protein